MCWVFLELTIFIIGENKLWTQKKKNTIVSYLKQILNSATISQKAVNEDTRIFVNYLEERENEKFQEGIDFAIEVIADELGISEKELYSLF